MPYDYKYGKVTLEHDTMAEDEPVFVFRAKDKLLPKVISYYHLFCLKEGSPRRHLDLILNAKEMVENWQKDHEIKVPDSEASRSWMKS